MILNITGGILYLITFKLTYQVVSQKSYWTEQKQTSLYLKEIE